MYTGIYRIVNQVTNRTYIGSSVNALERLKGHRKDLVKQQHGNSYLQASWNKHGAAVFVFEPLVEVFAPVECIKKALLVREQEFIDAYFDHDMPLYNMRPSAESNSNYPTAPEVIEKIRASSKERMTPEAKEKISKFHKGKKRSPEALVALTEAGLKRRGIPLSKAHKDKLKAKARLRWQNPDNCKAQSVRTRKLAYKHTDDAKARIGAASLGNTNVRGTTLSKETKDKMSRAKLGKKKSKATRKRMSIAQLKRFHGEIAT